MAIKGALVKIDDPREGVTREQYEAICAALGVKPKPPKTTTTADGQSAPG